MLLAVDSQIVKRDFRKPIPRADALEDFSRALALMQEFWKRAASDTWISKGFRRIAAKNGKILSA